MRRCIAERNRAPPRDRDSATALLASRRRDVQFGLIDKFAWIKHRRAPINGLRIGGEVTAGFWHLRSGGENMLVIISDLHLTDGTSGATISPAAFSIFAERLRDLAMNASWRADGRYRPVERIDLLLLGDVLDVIRSTRWNSVRVRPWDDVRGNEMAETVGLITADILERNDESLQVLRALTRDEAIRLPVASVAGQPALRGETLGVPVAVHYLLGNHDWFFHLPGPMYDRIRQMIVQCMGLAHVGHGPFAHDPEESEQIAAVLRAHRVWARHGDIYDPFNFEGDRNASSLGDALVIELVNRFTADIERTLGEELPAAALAGLREVDNIRPLLLAPVWIDGLLERTCAFPAQRKLVKQVWDRLADEFLQLNFVRQRDSWNPADLVDGLQQALMFSRQVSLAWASRIIEWLHGLACPTGESYYRHALSEREFRNRGARHIVYGHTHHEESVPLDTCYTDAGALDQWYFNAGTWRRVYRPTRLAPHEHEFIAADVMTYLAFFQGDERTGRPYETWSGTLGLETASRLTYRLDSAHAGRQPLSPSAVSGFRPHFLLSRAPGRTGPSTGKRGV